jgi:hypothetical protein
MGLIIENINGRKCYGLDSLFFEIGGEKYQIIASRVPDDCQRKKWPSWMDMIHTVKDLKTGEKTDWEMVKLVNKLLGK